ncbi:unnamed protein product [Chondrus crispus]|uniref:Uncharacterized protein n=1 Tax=Chondrus crispus TaxID=2769 RepID=R7QCG0_CHOCR|nr:unnamed protein product [Chondrus crispus]CDF35150.1 unnamed protein product [Chondrus crispus]|eukprot:XP_005714969.1 unnamed protein product [Chondrus crispus]
MARWRFGGCGRVGGLDASSRKEGKKRKRARWRLVDVWACRE